MSGSQTVMVIEAQKHQNQRWGKSNSVHLVKTETQVPEKLQVCADQKIRFFALTDGTLWHAMAHI